MDGVVQVEVFDHRGQIIRIVVHVVTVLLARITRRYQRKYESAATEDHASEGSIAAWPWHYPVEAYYGIAKVRMKDVAEHAGVSTRTVSNVVNNFVHVSPQMRELIQQSLDELAYRMGYVARGLRSGRTGFIALVVPKFVGAVFR